jgi:hypothetical protein
MPADRIVDVIVVGPNLDAGIPLVRIRGGGPARSGSLL